MTHKIQSRAYQEILTTTVCAYLSTLPYVMYTFGTVSVYALLTNLLVLPLVPVMMLVTFFLIILAPLSHILALLVGYVDTLLGDFIILIAKTVEWLPFSSLSVSFSFEMMCGMYVLLACGYVYMQRRFEKKKLNETLPTKDDEIWSEVISY